MSDRIYMSSPDVGELEEKAIVAALRSGWVAPLGPDVDAFEREMSARVGVRHAVALSSGTAGLHLGLLALGVGSGDIVLTSSFTFAATANAIAYTGATPYFIDADAGPDPGAWPRGGLTEVRFRNHHLVYALTWFALAALVAGALALLWRDGRRSDG